MTEIAVNMGIISWVFLNFITESNDRLQVHLKERMHALEEKNALQQELDKLRKVLEDLQGEKVSHQEMSSVKFQLFLRSFYCLFDVFREILSRSSARQEWRMIM